MKIKILIYIALQFFVICLKAQTHNATYVDLKCMNGLWETVLINSSIREFTLFENTKNIKITLNQKGDNSDVYLSKGFLGYLDYELKFGDTIDIRELKMKGITLVAGDFPTNSFLTKHYSSEIMDIYCDEESFEQGGSVCVKISFIPKLLYNLILQKSIKDNEDYINQWYLANYTPFRKISVDNVQLKNDDLTLLSVTLKKDTQIEIIEEKFSMYKIICYEKPNNVGWIKKSDVKY